MKLYVKDNAVSNYKVDDTWEEIEDEIIETPIGSYLKSFTFTNEYKQRLAQFENVNHIEEIKARLNELSNDFIQAELGAKFDDLEERKAEFVSLHNELRQLLGKEPRIYE